MIKAGILMFTAVRENSELLDHHSLELHTKARATKLTINPAWVASNKQNN